MRTAVSQIARSPLSSFELLFLLGKKERIEMRNVPSNAVVLSSLLLFHVRGSFAFAAISLANC